MAEIDGGALSFKSVMDNDQMNAAIEETLRRIQGLSDGTVAGGKAMDNAFNSTADNIRKALGDIGTAIGTHESELQRLESEYQELGQKANKALMSGRDDEYRAITQQQTAIKGEITVRERLIKELQEQSNELEDTASKMEENKRKAEENANTQQSMRARIKELKEEMMLLVDQGIDEQSEAYKSLVAELGRLQDIQGDVAQQGRMLANDEQQFQGIITGLSGIAGGFSAVTGAMSLFGSENEDLQKVMTKIQSVMAITIGLQQVAQALNKDSAFQLVTLNGLKEWWRNIVVQATAAETAETVATGANTAAKMANATATGTATGAQAANTVATGTQATAATAGTIANIGLAGAFRLVGVAIKSIPVFGWILAGISALIGLVSIFSSKAREAKKAQEEFSKALIEGAYKPIGTIESLSLAYKQLGDNLESKKKFIEQNKKAFDELGVAINDVADAENLLVKNKDAFIDAQIAKAKAAVYLQQSMEKVKKQMQLEQEISKMSDTQTVYASYGMYGGGGYSYETENTAKTKKKKELEELTAEIKQGYQNVANEELNGYNILKNAGIDGSNTYKDGTIGAIEQAIAQKQAALKLLTSNADYKKRLEEITNLQKQLEGITGKPKTTSSANKDPFLDKLEKYKKEYTRFNKWVNSGDEILIKAANNEFQGLLKQGATYIDYLKNQRDIILSVDIASRTKAQDKQLQTLNDQIAEETKKTVLEAFNTELSDQLSNAKTTLEILNIIAQKRKELANDGTDLDNNKKETLDDAENNALAKQKQETDQLLQEYSSYLEKKIKLETDYNNDLALLEKSRSEATTDADRAKIDQAKANRTKQYEKDSKSSGDADYDEMLNVYSTFEQKKQAIIDDYDAKRKTAQEHNNEEMIAKLNEAQAKAISALASDELMGTEVWANLFGNLDELTAQQITTLVNEIESKFDSLSGVFNPVDLTGIRDKLNEAKAVLVKDNPFKQMGESLKAVFNDAGDDSKDSAQKIKKNWKQLAESTEKSFDFVVDAINSADFLKDAIGDVGATAISSMATVASVAIAVSTAIKTAEKSSVILAIIQAALMVVQAVVNVIGAIAGNKDKKIEKEIQKHADAVDRLEAAYTALSWAIDKALGGAVYKSQQAAIANMEKQREHLKAMWQAEESKKKTDAGKVNEYKDQYEQLGRDIQDMLDEISNDILQTDAKTFADELGDALVDAFAKGEDAANAFSETVDNVIKQAVLNQLKKNFLETQLQGALDGLEKSMGYWNGDEFIFDGLTDAEIAAFKNQVAGISSQFNQAMEAYSEVFKDIAPEDKDTSLTGSVKGVSEETASLVAGQMNAMRINQMEATAILRNQLLVLNTIANNTSYNRFLQDIDSKLDRITNSGDPLRSQGLS
jgi:DNA repair exonuclease SbcCD ATPase subunit